MGRIIKRSLLVLAGGIGFLLPGYAMAQDAGNCPRPAPGSEITPPPDVFSSNGALNVHLNYVTDVDSYGRTLLCFVTPDGLESPTLHVNPGDTINITLTNELPPAPAAAQEVVSDTKKVCGDSTMTLTSVNMHFHGTNTSPKCHSDEVIRTLVNSGETFTYTLKIPSDEPPGLYWYHPHVHGISSASVQAGATSRWLTPFRPLPPTLSGISRRITWRSLGLTTRPASSRCSKGRPSSGGW